MKLPSPRSILIVVSLIIILVVWMLFVSTANVDKKLVKHDTLNKTEKQFQQTQLQSPSKFFSSQATNHFMAFICGSGSWQAKYTSFHKESLEKLKVGQGSALKFLVYRCHSNCGGFGDRVLGIVTTFYLALLTNRVFLIDSNNPTDLSEVLNIHSIDWSFKDNEKYLSTFSFGTDEKIDAQGNADYRKFYSSGDVMNMFKEQVVISNYNQRIYLYIHENPTVQARKKQVGLNTMSTFHIFGCFFHYLFKVDSQVAKIIDEFWISNFYLPQGTNYKVIGVQLRLGGAQWSDPARITDEDVAKFWDCAKLLMKKFTDQQQPVKIFLTTDNQVEKEKAVKQFGDQVVTMNTPIVHIGRKNSQSNTLAIETYRSTLAEYIMLSLCDELIITRSNFAETATMLTFKPRFKLPKDECKQNTHPLQEFDFANEDDTVWYSA